MFHTIYNGFTVWCNVKSIQSNHACYGTCRKTKENRLKITNKTCNWFIFFLKFHMLLHVQSQKSQSKTNSTVCCKSIQISTVIIIINKQQKTEFQSKSIEFCYACQFCWYKIRFFAYQIRIEHEIFMQISECIHELHRYIRFQLRFSLLNANQSALMNESQCRIGDS